MMHYIKRAEFLENGQEKLAVALCDKILKKHPTSVVSLVYATSLQIIVVKGPCAVLPWTS